MFGLFKKKEEASAVGAKEKIRRAQLLQQGGEFDEGELKKKTENTPAPVAIIMIYAMSVGLVVLLPAETAFFGLSSFLGGNVFSAFGDLEDALTAAASGAMLFALCGIIPLCAFMGTRMSKNKDDEGFQLFALWVTGFVFLLGLIMAVSIL